MIVLRWQGGVFSMKRTPNMKELGLSKEQLALHGEVSIRVGHLAAVSLECVLLDGAKRFIGITPNDEEFIRRIATIREVPLPV